MQSKIQICLSFIPFFVMACSNGNSVRRTSGTDEPASSENVSAQSADKPMDDSEGMPGYTQARNPVPINGGNLVEVVLTAHCVIVKDSAIPCTDVRWVAKVKVDSELPVRFAANTQAALGISSFSWQFPNLPSGITCQATVGVFGFHPLCQSSLGSLSDVEMSASLRLVANDNAVFTGSSPKAVPSSKGSFRGNFVLIDGSSGLSPSGVSYSGASKFFTEIWQDMVSGLYVTNNLYEGEGTTSWVSCMNICSEVRTKEGSGGWVLPSLDQMLDLFGHSISDDLPVVNGGRSWLAIGRLWTSTSYGDNQNSSDAWGMHTGLGVQVFNPKSLYTQGAFCIHE